MKQLGELIEKGYNIIASNGTTIIMEDQHNIIKMRRSNNGLDHIENIRKEMLEMFTMKELLED